MANDNDRRLWDMTIQSGKVLNVCKGLAQTSPTECRAQADSNEALHDLTLLVLVNRGKRSFENALKSWDRHNLFHLVSKTIVFFQNLGIGTNIEEDPRVKILLQNKNIVGFGQRSLEEHGIKVIGSTGQVGIAKAYHTLVKAAETEHVMFVEEDFSLEHAINVEDELACSIDMLRQGIVDLIKLRHRQVPEYHFARAIGGLEMRNS